MQKSVYDCPGVPRHHFAGFQQSKHTATDTSSWVESSHTMIPTEPTRHFRRGSSGIRLTEKLKDELLQLVSNTSLNSITRRKSPSRVITKTHASECISSIGDEEGISRVINSESSRNKEPYQEPHGRVTLNENPLSDNEKQSPRNLRDIEIPVDASSQSLSVMAEPSPIPLPRQLENSNSTGLACTKTTNCFKMEPTNTTEVNKTSSTATVDIFHQVNTVRRGSHSQLISNGVESTPGTYGIMRRGIAYSNDCINASSNDGNDVKMSEKSKEESQVSEVTDGIKNDSSSSTHLSKATAHIALFGRTPRPPHPFNRKTNEYSSNGSGGLQRDKVLNPSQPGSDDPAMSHVKKSLPFKLPVPPRSMRKQVTSTSGKVVSSRPDDGTTEETSGADEEHESPKALRRYHSMRSIGSHEILSITGGVSHYPIPTCIHRSSSGAAKDNSITSVIMDGACPLPNPSTQSTPRASPSRVTFNVGEGEGEPRPNRSFRRKNRTKQSMRNPCGYTDRRRRGDKSLTGDNQDELVTTTAATTTIAASPDQQIPPRRSSSGSSQKPVRDNSVETRDKATVCTPQSCAKLHEQFLDQITYYLRSQLEDLNQFNADKMSWETYRRMTLQALRVHEHSVKYLVQQFENTTVSSATVGATNGPISSGEDLTSS